MSASITSFSANTVVGTKAITISTTIKKAINFFFIFFLPLFFAAKNKKAAPSFCGGRTVVAQQRVRLQALRPRLSHRFAFLGWLAYQ